jgi:hypothetical protein
MNGSSSLSALSAELEISSTLRIFFVSASLDISIMERADFASSRDQALTSYQRLFLISRPVAFLWKAADSQVQYMAK